MTRWPTVKLTQARQVFALMDVDEDDLPPAADDLHARYDLLRRGDAPADALDYIAHALPRQETVAWAARCLHDHACDRSLPIRDQLALDHAMRWIDEPSDTNRRATHAAAEAAGQRSPERLLGMAVFYSGGSIAPMNAAPVLAPPEACLRYAAGAVKASAYRSGTPGTTLAEALALAEQVAERGVQALAKP
ncbi:hypothetical protein C8J44_0028 [Sphingomonas sp. PP-CE-3A-406]|uniref:DUF6931 family protein n=1 Tax=Sphingomonas sp. PP-CE-3A-406 TaxID=2135659 RepID=UPI000EF956DA|nr:hypothetical protein [Sphingomonas sp. PP-CE-3A-406]RMB54802.1 hypothetical protein C8J44_0028 [Sphingomonas sp. PP-CE-3A-406]